MARDSREDERARMREALLAAARATFLEAGYSAATVEQMADRAGCPKDKAQAIFPSKEALFLELLSGRLDADAAELRTIADDAQSPETLVAGVRSFLDARGDALDFTRAAVEFLAALRPEGPTAQACADLYRRQRRAFAEILRALPHWAGQHEPEAADDAAAALVGMTLGLAVQRGVDPRTITPKVWARAVETCLAALATPKGPRLASSK